jgi:hypothetical protein
MTAYIPIIFLSLQKPQLCKLVKIRDGGGGISIGSVDGGCNS